MQFLRCLNSKLLNLKLLENDYSGLRGDCPYEALQIQIIEVIDPDKLDEQGINPEAYMRKRWVIIQYKSFLGIYNSTLPIGKSTGGRSWRQASAREGPHISCDLSVLFECLRMYHVPVIKEDFFSDELFCSLGI